MSLLKWPWLNTQPTPAAPRPIPPPPETRPATPPPDNPGLATARWDHKRFGMENFGNTCYANSVLQALYFCDPFRQLVCDAPDRSYPSTPEAIAAAQAAVAQLQPPATPKPKPAHVRRPSAADMTTPAHAGFAVGPGGLVASAFMAPPAAVPHKTTSAPTPAPIVNVGPVIPPLPPSLFSALRSLFIHIAANPADKGTVSPRAFVEKLKKENELFRSNMHQDAHEFLNYLLNSVVEDLTHEMKAGPPEDLSGSVASTSSTSNCSPHLTLVHDLFEGTLTSETRCLTCETVSSRDESFLDLSIDIERNSSVTACLRQFSASEMLCRGDKFFCDSCCGLQEAEKRMKIKKLPNVLALHLKRFKYQEDVQRYIKLSYRVAFPFELRLFNTVDDAEDPDRLYELFAIIVHVGSGPHHGHYITLAKQRGQWFAFDDDVVEPVQESAIPKYFGDSPAGSGYVLFYQAVNTDLQALGVKKSQVPSVPSEPIIPPVVVEAPTSPVSAVPVQALEEVVAKVSPDVSESGTIATPSPSTPTLSHPSSSPAMSKPDGLPPSTAPSSTVGSGFGRQSTKPSTGSSGSVQLFDPVSSVNGNTSINGHVQHESVQKVAEPATKTGWSKGKSTSWFGWPGKKKDKEKGTPASSRKATLEDTSHLPIIDIRRPSAPALMESLSGQVPTVNGTGVLHDEPDETPGLGVDFGRTAEPPLTGSISASSSGDHLLHSVPDHRHLRTSPPRVSRSGSVSATTSGSTGSGLHVPSYSPLRPSPSPSSSASSVSTPLRHNASAPKLGVPQSITPFPLTMSPVKERKRPSTASSIPPGEPPLTIVPPVPALSPPPVVTSPIRSHTIGPVDTLQTTKVKTPKRKMSFSNAFNSFARRDKSLGKLGTHDRRASVIEGAEGLSPLVVPATPTKRK
ncbi:ubiquitin carboxyl-terminal hydrolase [Rhizoctonia solani]|uniref:Ubiquitin carboxyl-terminal hydrolase n=1 Tax=Rhizoctonia solani TaxID=456999 RepID=A0A8H8NZC4_9AGAM|nr:ubiquitin carboxyl-terminal hydrolase [Rhizoctonia solani]QRW22220.1 ubiquitin carboxyl-terminal hydrolase [Rhizoctonia solani]